MQPAWDAAFAWCSGVTKGIPTGPADSGCSQKSRYCDRSRWDRPESDMKSVHCTPPSNSLLDWVHTVLFPFS